MLLYAFDPLCGWCFGLLPAMRLLKETHPELPIELVMGGLVLGARVGPYKGMEQYIRGAAPRMTQVTGQPLSEAFWQLIAKPHVISNSAPPIRAILQMQLQAPEKAVDFAHSLSHAHFALGADLGDLETVQGLAGSLAETLELPDYPQTNETHPLVQPEVRRARSMGVRSYPTLAVRTGENQAWHGLPSVYEPHAFVAQIEDALRGLSTAP